jgi:hypothetical protein
MIISHTHRYVFVELPRTGSTAVRRELRELYDGHPILAKHATYDEFRRTATDEEKTYFVFSTIRNPLDDAVSRYFKLRTDHKGQFTKRSRARRHRRLLNRLIDTLQFRYVNANDADFGSFLRRFYILPYDTWASLSHHRFDYVMRFERLEDDFAEAIRRIGLDLIRPLPVVNSTASRRRSFVEYYTPDLIPRARRVFGPYMQRWGYAFPPSWPVDRPTAMDRAQYLLYGFVARMYWRFVRPIT